MTGALIILTPSYVGELARGLIRIVSDMLRKFVEFSLLQFLSIPTAWVTH